MSYTEEIHKANARRDKHYAQLERRAKVFYCLLEKYNDEQCKNIVRTYMKQPQTIGGYLLDKYREFDAWFTRNFGWFFTNGNK